MPSSCAILCLVLAVPGPQEPDAALARFTALRTTQKAMLVARVRARLARTRHPALLRIDALRVDVEALPEAAPPPVFDPAAWAPGVAPERALVADGDPAHRTLAARFARAPLLPDLAAEVAYDWCRGVIVQRGWPLDYDELFANLLAGYPPGADHAVARVLAALDDDAKTRALASWFGHAYADLEARVYTGVTLYDAWYSGEIVDVPDVDAVPFAHEILGQRSLRSPLSGPPRDRLYEAIRRAALEYRIYRTLREAAAAAFVRAEPRMDAMYARLVPRFHYLFAAHGDALDRVRALLASGERDRLIAEIDRRVSDPDDDAFAVRESRRAQLAELQALVRDAALVELEGFAATHNR